jgi:hypothetical protein
MFWVDLGGGDNVDGSIILKESVGYLTPGFWAFKVNSYFKSFAFINPETKTTLVSILRAMVGNAGYVVLFLLNALLAIIVFWLIVRAILASFSEGKNDRFFWTAFVLAVPLYCLAPVKALGVSDPGARILQTALWVALLFVARPRRAGWAVATAAITLSVTNLSLFSLLVVRPQPQSVSVQTRLPKPLIRFAGVQYDGRDCYYKALDEGDMSKPVFPTGVFRTGSSSEDLDTFVIKCFLPAPSGQNYP